MIKSLLQVEDHGVQRPLGSCVYQLCFLQVTEFVREYVLSDIAFRLAQV